MQILSITHIEDLTWVYFYLFTSAFCNIVTVFLFLYIGVVKAFNDICKHMEFLEHPINRDLENKYFRFIYSLKRSPIQEAQFLR